MSGGVEILTQLVERAGSAVTNVTAGLRKREHQPSNFGGEGMMLPIASCVQPQDLPCRASVRQRVQHRQDGGGPNSRAEQDQRPIAGLQNKASARRTDVENISHPNMITQVGSSLPHSARFSR